MADQNKEAPNTLLSTQTLRVVDALCEGPISGFIHKSGDYGTDPLCSTYYDDVPVRNPDGSYNFNVSGQGFSFDYALGTVAQTGIEGFQKIENLLPLSSNTRIANPPQGGGPYKTVVTSFTTHTFPDADSVKVTVRIPALFAQDDNANTNLYEIEWAVDIAVNGGSFEPQPIPAGSQSYTDTIRGKCTQPYLKTVLLPLPKPGGTSFYEWKVRVRRVSQNILLMKTQNEIYVDSISVVSTNLFAYPNTAIVATEISADQFSSVPNRSYELAGMLVNVPAGYTPTQYPVTGGVTPAIYPEVWDGTFQSGVWTDNPAWVFYDLLTNPTHGLGDYILPSYVDKWTLYSIGQYCDTLVSTPDGGSEPQFTCNVQIQQPEEAYSVLLNLASTFRGMLYYANGTIQAVQTKDTPPVFQFTNANVVNGAFNYSDSARNTRATVAVVKWIDPDNGYRESVEYVEDTEGILKYGYNEKQMTAFACTSRGQAYRLGKWTLETERLQTETVTFQTDLEGVYLRPGDNFAIYDNFRNNRSQGGRITAFQTGRSVVTIDRPVEVKNGLTYTLTALIPQLALMGTGDVTGSSQIDYIRNSQIETYQVITSPTTSTSTLTISGQFNTGLFVGSPFVLSASGYTGTFDTASFYTCLATAEVEPGKIEILGLKASTGVYFRVLTGTSVIDYSYPAYDWPNNPGDSSAISPPSNLFVTGITGLLEDNTVYTNIKLTWDDSTSPNLAQYIVSGKAWDEGYSAHPVGTNSFIWGHAKTGQYLFHVGALSLGGVHSPYITGGYFVEYLNPFDTMPVLSGIEIIEDYDPLYKDPSNGKYTGYMGRTPTFRWSVTGDGFNNVPEAQFISGYKLWFYSHDGMTTYAGPVNLDGPEGTTYQMPEGYIDTFLGGPQRGFKVSVDVLDIDEVVYPEVAYLNVNNPPMKPPFSSGFVGFNGGVSYNITPSVQYDTSGIYLWCEPMDGLPFTPTFSNYDYNSSNLAGFANIAPNTGSFNTWFALADTWGSAGNEIYGPISGNSNAMFGDLFDDISDQISAAFGLLTGEITDIQRSITGLSGQTLQWIEGLSGQFVDASGDIYQGLSVSLQQIIAQSGSVLSTQINAVAANVSTLDTRLGATGSNVLTAIATTGGALASMDTALLAYTSGTYSKVRIAAESFVTGSSPGSSDTKAIARWGFQLDANGKASSLVATSTSFSDIGDLVLGNMNIKSNSFVAGSAGWQISYGGNAEFNDIIARGVITGGNPAGSYISLNGLGLKLAEGGGSERIELTTTLGAKNIDVYNSSNSHVVRLGTANVASTFPGFLSLKNNAGVEGIALYGNGTANFGASVYFDGAVDFNSTTNFDGASTHNAQVNITSTHKLHFSNAGTNISYIAEDYGLNLWGDSTHPIKIRGGALVRGATSGGPYTAGDIYGFGIPFGADTTDANTFDCDTVGGSDSTFANYLKIKGPGGSTIYVPYRTTAP